MVADAPLPKIEPIIVKIKFQIKFIIPILLIIIINYCTIFVPMEYERITVCITLVLSLVAFNLVAATAKIPEMPYLNIFDWFTYFIFVLKF